MHDSLKITFLKESKIAGQLTNLSNYQVVIFD